MEKKLARLLYYKAFPMYGVCVCVGVGVGVCVCVCVCVILFTARLVSN